MSAELFDTHCHLNLAESFPDPDAEIERAKSAGVTQLCLVGIELDSCRRAVAIAERHEGVYAIVGWHPNSAASFTEDGLLAIRDLLSHPKAVALGEIGLDYHWDYATPEQQTEALLRQLDLSQELEKPVVFHCRKAYPDLLSLLESRPPRPYLFHCFSGGREDAARVKALNGWIGVNGPLTYKKADELRTIVAEWPHERLVLETDSPYLTPEPHRGKPNHPAYLPLVNAALAGCWGCSPEESARQTVRNAREFFGPES
jgi:TatD DNase family protein